MNINVNNDNEIWVFLSHSHEDYEKVRKVRDMLEDQNMRPLMFFLKCLNDHDEIDSLIKREIDCRTRFIYCKSNNTEDPDGWVQREVEYISSKDRNFETIDLNSPDEELLQRIDEIKKNATIFISYNRDEYDLAEQVYDRLSKYDLDISFDRYFLRRGSDFENEMQLSIDEACNKGHVIALLRNRVLSEESFVRKELGRALLNDRFTGSRSIIPFYLDEGLKERIEQDNELKLLANYNGIDLFNLLLEKRTDIIVNEVLKQHYRPGTILFYSNYFADKNNRCYDIEESKKLKMLYSEIKHSPVPFLHKLFGNK